VVSVKRPAMVPKARLPVGKVPLNMRKQAVSLDIDEDVEEKDRSYLMCSKTCRLASWT
jgi:hypothetical protein